jgi:short-subunit dehydrogenase
MNKLAVVSGSSKGIGKAIAINFAAKGFDVVLASRNLVTLNDLKIQIENDFKVNCFVFQADLSIKSEVIAFGDFVLSLNRPIDVLVNNAGVFLPGQIQNEEEGVLEAQINTNLYSAYNLTRKLISKLTAQQYGHIFNICSIASLQAYAHSGSYTISKFAMLGFSKSLRDEMKNQNVKVTSVMPGATLTDSWAGVDLPVERFIQSEDIAKMIWSCYELSPSAVVEDLVIRPQLGDI